MKELKPHSYKLILRDISEGDQAGFEIFVPAFHAHCYGDTIEGVFPCNFTTYILKTRKSAERKRGLKCQSRMLSLRH